MWIGWVFLYPTSVIYEIQQNQWLHFSEVYPYPWWSDEYWRAGFLPVQIAEIHYYSRQRHEYWRRGFLFLRQAAHHPLRWYHSAMERNCPLPSCCILPYQSSPLYRWRCKVVNGIDFFVIVWFQQDQETTLHVNDAKRCFICYLYHPKKTW